MLKQKYTRTFETYYCSFRAKVFHDQESDNWQSYDVTVFQQQFVNTDFCWGERTTAQHQTQLSQEAITLDLCYRLLPSEFLKSQQNADQQLVLSRFRHTFFQLIQSNIINQGLQVSAKSRAQLGLKKHTKYLKN